MLNYLRVSVTAECNVKCWYCFNEGIKKECTCMEDIDSFRWLMDAIIRRYSLGIVRFTGGEPLLNPMLPKFIEAVQSLGIRSVGITTNGTLLDKCIDIDRVYNNIRYAMHIWQMDCGLMDMNPIYRMMEAANASLNNVRFNVVVTSRNITFVRKIIAYAYEHNISLLLLDLLRTNMKHEAFQQDYRSLDYLVDENKYDLVAETESCNVVEYKNEKMSIKTVSHYSTYKDEVSYCTRALKNHPFVLSPNFELIVCSHFGSKSFKLEESIRQRDILSLYRIIDDAIVYRQSCQECKNKYIL